MHVSGTAKHRLLEHRQVAVVPPQPPPGAGVCNLKGRVILGLAITVFDVLRLDKSEKNPKLVLVCSGCNDSTVTDRYSCAPGSPPGSPRRRAVRQNSMFSGPGNLYTPSSPCNSGVGTLSLKFLSSIVTVKVAVSNSQG